MPIIKTNIPAQQSLNNLRKTQKHISTSMERLASGLRVNGARDNAAGQAISNRMKSQINGQTQAARNASDGISISQTAQGALDEINQRLQRIRELSVQGLNGLYNGETGDRIQAEINLNLKEIDRLNSMASFNGIPLLNGNGGTRSLQVGANDSETLDVNLNPPGFSVQELGLQDMTIQGVPGKVTPVATLLGSAYSLPLDAPETMLTFYPPDSSPNLVDVLRPQSRDVIQLDDNGGQLKEYRLIKSTHDTDTRLNIVEIEVQSATVITTAGESISKRTYKDIAGNTITLNNPSIVSRSDQYWIQYDTAGEQRFLPAELTIMGGENEVIAQAKDATPLTLAEMPASFSTLNYAPQISKSTSNYTLTLDGSDESSNADLNLVYLGGYYYIEEKVADQYQYYYADITIKTGSNQNSIDVQADRSIKLSVTDQPYVSGSSTIYFKPENANVTVNYIDSTGAQYNDVMRPDSEKDYTFNIGQSSNAEGTYKTANIVTDQNGDLLLQTVNGTAEVILYYPMSVSVNTNVNNNSTIVTLRETGEAQRLRNPPMPLAAIDAAIARVDSKRGELGALDNRLASVIEGNVTTRNNLDAARSRIMDAEYAREVAAMTRAQILQQAGNSLLAQATQLPQGVLSLLR